MCVAVCCSVLQCAAACCSVLCGAFHILRMQPFLGSDTIMEMIALGGRVLQCVAVCRSVLQCVAVAVIISSDPFLRSFPSSPIQCGEDP